MLEVVSFGAAWSSWYKGYHVSFAPSDRGRAKEIQTCPRSFQYHFSLDSEDYVGVNPSYLTWYNDDSARWVYDDPTPVDDDALDERVLKRWHEFTEQLLLPAIDEKRVIWRVCAIRSGQRHYADYARWLRNMGRTVVNY